MHYLDSLRFVSQRKGWFVNLLLMSVCFIIPAVGPIVVMGYLFEVFDALRRDPEHRDYPLFDFNRFVPYLTRGVWPFLVQFIMQLVVSIPIAGMYFLAIIVTLATSKGGGGGTAVTVIAWIMYAFVVLVLSILSALLQWPMSIYAGIRQKFDIRGMMTFTKDFLRRNLKELTLSLLFIMAVSAVLIPLGMLALCVGVYLSFSFILVAQHHLEMQLYERHLAKGGIPVEDKPPLSVEMVSPDADREFDD